jgi:ABC-type transport system substrate-binding protein
MRSILTRFDVVAAALAGAAISLLVAPLGCTVGLHAPIPAASAEDAPPRRGGTLRLASLNDITGLDPAGPTNGLQMQAFTLIFDGLVDFDRDAHVIPNLADRWEIDDGGRTYRFILHAGVQMHDGRELTADDVKRSVERALHPSTPNPIASSFEGIDGYEAYAAGKAEHLAGVVVEGRYVVSFHLVEPDAAFLSLLAVSSMRPVCATAGDRFVDTWLPCGAGPFKLEPGGWQRGVSLRVVRHDGYFRAGLPYLDAVEWTFTMQQLPQRFRFEDGSLDLIQSPTQADTGRFMADPRWKAMGVPLFDNTTHGEAMNTRVPPFDNVEIRRAVAAVIDRERYAWVKPQQMSPLTQLLPRGMPGYDPSFEGQRHDVSAALEHMRKAGFPYDPQTGTGGWPHPIAYIATDPSVESYTSQLLQQELAGIGLRIELRFLSWSAWVTLSERGDATMTTWADQADYPDPNAFFEALFTTESLRGESSVNVARYSNPVYDAVVARARREMDPIARRALFRQANEILCDQAPWAFTYAQHDFVIHQPYVRGFAAHPVWSLDVRGVWLDRSDADAARALSGGLR